MEGIQHYPSPQSSEHSAGVNLTCSSVIPMDATTAMTKGESQAPPANTTSASVAETTGGGKAEGGAVGEGRAGSGEAASRPAKPEPTRNADGQMYCAHEDCADKSPQIFRRRCEWT